MKKWGFWRVASIGLGAVCSIMLALGLAGCGGGAGPDDGGSASAAPVEVEAPEEASAEMPVPEAIPAEALAGDWVGIIGETGIEPTVLISRYDLSFAEDGSCVFGYFYQIPAIDYLTFPHFFGTYAWSPDAESTLVLDVHLGDFNFIEDPSDELNGGYAEWYDPGADAPEETLSLTFSVFLDDIGALHIEFPEDVQTSAGETVAHADMQAMLFQQAGDGAGDLIAGQEWKGTAPDVPVYPAAAYTTTDVLNLREHPYSTSDYGIIKELPEGTAVQEYGAYANNPDWAFVLVEDGSIGWVSKDFLAS